MTDNRWQPNMVDKPLLNCLSIFGSGGSTCVAAVLLLSLLTTANLFLAVAEARWLPTHLPAYICAPPQQTALAYKYATFILW